MRKIILLPILLILVASIVNAAILNNFLSLNYIPNPMIVSVSETECNAEQLFKAQVNTLNSMPIFLDAIEAFDDGDHVIYLKENEYSGSKYITIHKNNGKIIWIKSGKCAAVNGYDSYVINFDIENIQLEEGNSILAGYNLLKQIDGVSTMQKLMLVKTAIKFGLTNMDILK